MIDSLELLESADPLLLTAGEGHDKPHFRGVRTVLLDADDTLWENNLFFLQSIEWLCRQGRRLGHTDRAVLALLNRWEDFNISRMGYGYDSYERSFLMTIRILVARAGAQHLHGGIYTEARKLVAYLKRHPIIWLPTVEETLPDLRERFRVIVVTKGNMGDQSGKVERCGLKHLFHDVEVVPHKYAENYLHVLEKYHLDADETVMVGNSPKSDINNPRKAGLRTVFLPHPRSWFREHEPIAPDNPPTIQIARFQQLLEVLEP
jgi:putative hydrolase of the HAD superfamily